jgi:FG-GAP repeat
VATNFIAVPDWFSWQNESAGVAVADLNGDGRPELVVFMIDHATPGPNAGWYRIGRNLDQAGNVSHPCINLGRKGQRPRG